MRTNTLIILLLLSGAFKANAQAQEWLKGTWFGETNFTNNRVAKRVIVRMRMLEIKGNNFKAQYVNMYPNDTTVRLERILTGKIVNQKLVITKSVETYLLDPRTRSFWSDCTQCNSIAGIGLEGENLVLKTIIKGCSDACDGETVFSRSMADYDSATQARVYKLFSAPGNKTAFKVYRKPDTTSANTFTLKVPNDSSLKMHSEKDTLANLSTVIINKAGEKTTAKQRLDSTGKLTKPVKTNTANKNKNDIDLADNSSKSSILKSQKALPKNFKDSTAKAGIAKTLKASVTANKKLQKTTKVANQNGVVNTTKKSEQNTGNIGSIEIIKPAEKDSVMLASNANETLYRALKNRTTNLINTYQINAPDIIITLYDNAEIDGDIVSVFHNGKLIINNQTLSRKPLSFRLKVSAAEPHHEFVLVAENLGLIPPNTALMRIIAGNQKIELEVASNLEQNAKVNIDYIGK